MLQTHKGTDVDFWNTTHFLFQIFAFWFTRFDVSHTTDLIFTISFWKKEISQVENGQSKTFCLILLFSGWVTCKKEITGLGYTYVYITKLPELSYKIHQI